MHSYLSFFLRISIHLLKNGRFSSERYPHSWHMRWLISQKESLLAWLLVVCSAIPSSLLVKGLISRWLHVLSWQKNVRLSTLSKSEGSSEESQDAAAAARAERPFFRPQVWQSNSSLETCKVSRETNWPFDTAAANFWSLELSSSSRYT